MSSLYRKTGTSRQAQLVRLLLQLPTTSPVNGSTAFPSEHASAQHAATSPSR
jgi:hypothetical protein